MAKNRPLRAHIWIEVKDQRPAVPMPLVTIATLYSRHDAPNVDVYLDMCELLLWLEEHPGAAKLLSDDLESYINSLLKQKGGDG